MLTDVAKALTTALLAAGFPAERRYLPRRKLEDYNQPRVTVVARGDELDLTDGTRGLRLRTYTIDVAYQQRLTQTEPAAEEAELDLHETQVDRLLSALDPENLADLSGAKIVGVTRYAGEEAPYSMKHLTEMRLYTAVVKVTLEEYREVA
jgi:hypothetical protein